MWPGVVSIEQPDDPRLDDYRQIKERDLVGRRGMFVAEGSVVLRALVSSVDFEPVSFLIAEHRAQAASPLFEHAGAQTPVYLASQAVMNAVAGFDIHRGILAIGRRRGPQPDLRSRLAALPPDALAVAVFGVGNHDNVGALFRNAAAFGADAVLLDERCCDPLYRKALRVSVGAGLTVSWARGGGEGALLDALIEGGFDLLALSPTGGDPVSAIAPTGRRTALLVGAEGPGLSAAVLARTRTVRIPMAPGFDSLNVAAAAAVGLRRLSRLS
ncbi:RNA methyltransferase [soil metagenome]